MDPAKKIHKAIKDGFVDIWIYKCPSSNSRHIILEKQIIVCCLNHRIDFDDIFYIIDIKEKLR